MMRLVEIRYDDKVESAWLDQAEFERDFTPFERAALDDGRRVYRTGFSFETLIATQEDAA